MSYGCAEGREGKTKPYMVTICILDALENILAQLYNEETLLLGGNKLDRLYG